MSRTRLFGILPVVAFACILMAAPRALASAEGFNDPGSHSTGGATGAGLAPVVDAVDGGKIPIGATAQVVVRFKNDGSQPVETGLIRLYPSSTVSVSVALNQCEEAPLASGAECAIALSVKGLQAGPWRTEMLMSHSGRARLVTATVSGLVETTGDGSDKLTSDVQTIPDIVDFGSMQESQTLTKPVTLRNITSTTIDLTDIYIDSSEQSGYSLKTDCKKLLAGQSCIAVITWAPKLKGKTSGVLVVKHTGPAALSSVPITGEYTPVDVAEAEVFPQAVPGRGLIVASQKELDFGTGVGTASTLTVSLVNTGDAEVKIKDILISGTDNGLSFKEGGCAKDMLLKPIEACPLTITWSPTRVGAILDDVQIAHDGTRGILVLPIKGTATATVSQDQKAIVLDGMGLSALPAPAETSDAEPAAPAQKTIVAPLANAASLLDGYKITSFSANRAIINGPGGSRIVFDNEEIVLGGVPWFVVIQKNGIEFLHQGQRILLLFDRSLSSINRISASSDSEGSSSSAPATSSGSTTEATVADDTNG